MIAAALFSATFAMVFALSIQQLNVQGGHRGLAFGTSWVIGGMQLALFKFAPSADTTQAIAFLAGGPFGVVAAMAWHPWLVRWWKHRRG